MRALGSSWEGLLLWPGLFQDLLPECLNVEASGPRSDVLVVEVIAHDLHDPRDVAKVFVRSTFAEVLQFLDDDVLWRSEASGPEEGPLADLEGLADWL